jgi:hypothetical protein
VRRLAPFLAVLALAGCGGGGEDETAAEFATRVVGLLEQAEPGQAWDELHPAHREHVPRALYVRCEGDEGLGGEVTELEVAGVHDERASVPGLGEEPSTEVVLELLLHGEQVELDMHVFDVDGEWTWVIGAHDYAAYSAGRCP